MIDLCHTSNWELWQAEKYLYFLYIHAIICDKSENERMTCSLLFVLLLIFPVTARHVSASTSTLICMGQYFIFFKVTGLDTAPMSTSISCHLSKLKCRVKAVTCQNESHLSLCSFTFKSEAWSVQPSPSKHPAILFIIDLLDTEESSVM